MNRFVVRTKMIFFSHFVKQINFLISYVNEVVLYFLVLEVEAFERLLGPCMDIMKRNIDDYETQLIKIFGSKNNISDIR